MEALRTSISAMQSAADAVSPRDSGDTPVRPGIPAALLHSLHPGSAHSAESAESAIHSAAPPDPQTARARRRCVGRQTEMIENAAYRARLLEWTQSNATACGHSDADCTARQADYSDWKLSPRLMAELFPVIEHLQAKNVKFVEWSIRYMAVKGKRQPMLNGTRSCGGYSKVEMIGAYAAASPGAPEIAQSVFNNKRVPALGTLWTIAQELRTNTQKRLSLEVDVNAPLPGRRSGGRRGRRRQLKSKSPTDSAESESDSETSQNSDSGCQNSDSGSGAARPQA